MCFESAMRSASRSQRAPSRKKPSMNTPSRLSFAMAGTVSNVHVDGGTTVLLVGQFHSNLDGGTVEMLRRHMPDASLLVVTLRRDQDDPPDDPPPADLVVDTSTEPR